MKTLSEYYFESVCKPNIVLAIRLLNGNNHAIFWSEDLNTTFKYLVYDSTDDISFSNEINEILKWLIKFNGNGYKAINELDRLNDLHKLSSDEINLGWYKDWWNTVGQINQSWLQEN